MLEGVAFSLRDTFGVLSEAGVPLTRLVAVGGGMRLPLWRQIVADVLGRPMQPLATSDQSAVGAAILAGASSGVFPDVATAIQRAVRYGPTVQPNPTTSAVYDRLFDRYQQLYPLSRMAL